MSPKTVLTKCCPVCGGNRFQPVERHRLGTAEADTRNISSVLGFRCGKGHFFSSADQKQRTLKHQPRRAR